MHDNNLRNILRSAGAEQLPAEDDCGLPSLKERAYQPHARPSQKPLYSIHFILPKGDVWSFQYVHLDSRSSYRSGLITICFMAMETVRVEIHGRNLWRLYDYIHQHRMPWVMQAVRDFVKDEETIVTGIRIAPESAEDAGAGDAPAP
jgi:hypothetical protein